jgi:hypothetical protein
MSSNNSDRPFFSIWFGNFFEPFYSDFEATRKGKVHSSGFEYGYACCRRPMPIVPPQYDKREMHPMVLLRETPVAALAGTSPLAPMSPTKGVEFARFGNKLVVVNHRSGPVNISVIKAKKEIAMVPPHRVGSVRIRQFFWNSHDLVGQRCPAA